MKSIKNIFMTYGKACVGRVLFTAKTASSADLDRMHREFFEKTKGIKRA